MPFESWMRFGSCGLNAGRGGMGICCQFVACAAALEGFTKIVVARIVAGARSIEKRSRRVFIAHLLDRMGLDRRCLDWTRPDWMHLDHRLVPRPRLFRSRLWCGWCL